MSPPEIKPQNYVEERPAEFFAKYHERSRTKDPNLMYTLARVVTTAGAWGLWRTGALNVDRVPDEGPLILAPNHASQMDHFFSGAFLRRQIRFMAKSQMFGHHKVGDLVWSHGGVFPVRRGVRDDEAITTALTILEKGGMLLMYPEGGRSRDGKLGEPRRGIGKIALESGATVVPIAIHNSHLCRGWTRGKFPKVTVSYGERLNFGPESSPSDERQLEVASEIFSHVRTLHAELEQMDSKQRPGVFKTMRTRPFSKHDQ